MKGLLEIVEQDIRNLLKQEAELTAAAKAAAESGNVALCEEKLIALDKVHHAIFRKAFIYGQAKINT